MSNSSNFGLNKNRRHLEFSQSINRDEQTQELEKSKQSTKPLNVSRSLSKGNSGENNRNVPESDKNMNETKEERKISGRSTDFLRKSVQEQDENTLMSSSPDSGDYSDAENTNTPMSSSSDSGDYSEYDDGEKAATPMSSQTGDSRQGELQRKKDVSDVLNTDEKKSIEELLLEKKIVERLKDIKLEEQEKKELQKELGNVLKKALDETVKNRGKDAKDNTKEGGMKWDDAEKKTIEEAKSKAIADAKRKLMRAASAVGTGRVTKEVEVKEKGQVVGKVTITAVAVAVAVKAPHLSSTTKPGAELLGVVAGRSLGAEHSNASTDQQKNTPWTAKHFGEASPSA